jgi:diguanylate cyclase (GGDEF)-like protein
MAVCAHDLRSPLNVILGHAQLLSDGVCGELTERQRSSIGAILREGARMLDLIEEMVDASQTGTDMLEVTPGALDLTALLTECRDAMAVAAADKEQRLDLAVRSDLGNATADGPKVREAVVNLLGNAIKFTPVGGHITLGADGDASQVILWVRDTGPGIPPEESELIFERFHRGRGAVGTRGAGLGLAICREIAERHGGAVWVEHPEGGGAMFRMSLPRSMPVREEAVRKTAGQILVIDDDDAHAQLLQAVLTRKGYSVEVAADGGEGVRRARDLRPDLVLLDVMMPSIDGFTAAERLRRDRRTREIPILFLSACVEAEAKVRGLDLGASDYLIKPFHMTELTARIARAIHEARERTALAEQARCDDLTGLGNYRYLVERLREEEARALRYGTPLAVVMLDLDDFKGINDRNGHACGNSALRAVADALRDEARDSDVVARYGGDEFVVLLPHARSRDARRFVTRVKARLSHLRLAEAAEVRLSASFGIATSASGRPHEGRSDRAAADPGIDPVGAGHGDVQLLTLADGALYRAKRRGRGGLCVVGNRRPFESGAA